MTLPKINDTPSYELVIPSTKQKVSYRPFLVKEQKVLLIAMESQDELQIVKSVADTIKSCITENLDISKLTSFDLEYMFTMIRSKSVGETSRIQLSCSECDFDNVVNVDLSSITIDVPEDNNRIQLTDKYTIQLKYPDYTGITHVDGITESAIESIYNMTLLCLDKLHTEDELVDFKDYSTKEQIDFIESLSAEQFDKILEFIRNIPKLTHNIDFQCEQCNHHNSLVLEGIQDFF